MKNKYIFPLAIFSLVTFLITCRNRHGQHESKNDMTTELNEQKQSYIRQEQEENADFLVTLSDECLLEIEMGKLAGRNGLSREVKDLGSMMDEHFTKINDQLKFLALKSDIALPTALSDESRDKLARLAKKKGSDFDKTYVRDILEEHENSSMEFERKINKDILDPDLHKLIIEIRPILQSHFIEIEVINDKINEVEKNS